MKETLARSVSDLAGYAKFDLRKECGNFAMAKYQVELTVIKVPVPADELASWKQSVANLYARLEEMVQEDKERKTIATPAHS